MVSDAAMGPEIEDAASVCRLCDKTTGNLLSIFQKNGQGLQIINVIKECLPIVIYRTDPLSKEICESCNEIVDTIYSFKQSTLDVVQKQKEDLLLKSPDAKIQLYLDLLSNQNGENTKCNGVDPLANDKHHNAASTTDVSTLTESSFHFNDTHHNEESSDLLSVISTADNNTMNGIDDTESDMELETLEPTKIIETNNRKRRRIRGSDYNSPIPKRRRVIGPKSKVESPVKYKTVTLEYFNPLSLLRCSILAMNKHNIDGFDGLPYDFIKEEHEEIVYYCNYCKVVFETASELGIHEMNDHIQLSLEPVDLMEYWDDDEEDANVRNKWLKASYHLTDDFGEEEEEEEEEDLLMPMEEETEEGTVDTTLNKEIMFVNEQPTINGVPLRDLPKDKRSEFYQSVRLSGVRRKFCNLCRYTFKDNWAIELHYMSRTCYYSCNYCGVKYNKNKPAFAEHVKDHVRAGHKKSDKVFVNRSKGGTEPKLLNASLMKPYIPVQRRCYGRKVKPIIMKSLMEKKRVNPSTFPTFKREVDADYTPAIELKPVLKKMTTADLTEDTQAYFCKKCYQVFARFDEYQVHHATCTGEIDDPAMKVIRPYIRKEKEQTPQTYNYNSAYTRTSIKQQAFDDTTPPQVKGYSMAGRPIRHCVREVSYSDEKEVEFRASPSVPGRFECNFCCSVFPTVHSRNSHMRIHKSNFKQAATPNKPPMRTYMDDTPNRFNPVKKIKQEIYEPIVDIHEGHSSNKQQSTSVGSVSITPLRRNNQQPATTISPAIMKLVQNNPNITLKPKAESNLIVPKLERQSPPLDNYDDSQQDFAPGERTYKCSSCNKPFANKSNLYFHKKNQCGGSKYPCPFCKKRFGTEASYSSHIFYSHPV